MRYLWIDITHGVGLLFIAHIEWLVVYLTFR